MITKTHYLNENRFLLGLTELSPRQSGFSDCDIERLATEHTEEQARRNPQVLARSLIRAYELIDELGYEMNEQERFVPSNG